MAFSEYLNFTKTNIMKLKKEATSQSSSRYANYSVDRISKAMQRMHTCCIWAFGVFVMLIFTPQSRVVFCVLPPLCLIVSCLEMANDLRGGGG